jgi:hypothetical protein
LFTDPIFSEGFAHRDAWVHGTADALAGTAAMIEIMTAMSKTMKVGWYALFLNWHFSFIQSFTDH